MTRGLLALVPSEGNPLLIQPLPDLRILLFTLAVDVPHRHRVRPVAGAAGQPPGSVEHAQRRVGSIAGAGGSVFLRKGLVAAQVALSSRAAVRRRAVRAEPAESEGHRHRLPRPRQPGDVPADPALNGYNEAAREAVLIRISWIAFARFRA